MKATATLMMFCVSALLALSMVILYSLGMSKGGAYYLVRQSIWCAIGLVACFSLSALDYRDLKKVSLILWLITVVLLVLVLVPGIGIKAKGARRWLGLGEVRFQPSELAKVVLVIVLAHYGEYFQRQIHSLWRGVLPACLVIGCMLVPILREPDRGTTVFLGALSVVMLLMAGVRWLVIFLPTGAAVAGLAFLFHKDPMIINRVLNGWINMDANKDGIGYQPWQALLAFGSGGVTGLGLGNGRQKMGFIPELQTDFILPVIGEELGLVATLSILAIYVVFVICGLRIARRAPDTFGFLLAFGLTFLIGAQACINVAVVTSVLPNKGLPLPFISYGGSNLVMLLTAVGILLSIARHSEVSAPEVDDAYLDEQPPQEPRG
jgi:cell division protein FtsW